MRKIQNGFLAINPGGVIFQLIVSRGLNNLQTRNGGRGIQVSLTLCIPLRLADDESLLPVPVAIMADKAGGGFVRRGVVDLDLTERGREKVPPLLQGNNMSGG